MHQRILITAALLAALAPARAQQLGDPSDAVTKKLQAAAAAAKVSARQIVTGRPFSANEERHSLQILSDGTRIETRQTTHILRDAEGRTRVEESNGTVALLDPKAGLSVNLNPASKLILNKNATNTPLLAEQQDADLKKAAALNRKTLAPPTETLAPQMMGGVLAKGTRTTTTIPMGALGNDRPINIVTERWYSDDLQILLKSINSDPRFGDTTYEVTNIVQGPQDPALFQIPADYVSATDANIMDQYKRKLAEENKRKLEEELQQRKLKTTPQ
ncbi:MAG TPA: hypothetical protein VGN17_23275 [Bryobacteraceae bacterium]|jgi:hypothetical protein